MASADKLFVVHPKDGVVRVQEVGMEDDLNAVCLGIEHLYPANLTEDRVVVVVSHVVSSDRRQRVALQSEDTTLEQNFVFVREQLVGRWYDSVLPVVR